MYWQNLCVVNGGNGEFFFHYIAVSPDDRGQLSHVPLSLPVVLKY